jgi:hypothetical protein
LASDMLSRVGIFFLSKMYGGPEILV